MKPTTISLLLVLIGVVISLQGCFATQILEQQRDAIRMRAANEHDCHLLHVDVLVVEDKKGIFRSTGCGHEEFWSCKEDKYGGPDLCDRVPFPQSSMFKRF